jgi:16S rRNA (guanine966-N2)-methyltransferase
MRIIGGKFKGRNFYMPLGVRPTQNVVRKSLFDSLGQDLSGSSFLELFAGSGAVGFEAFSRGAAPVILVEHDLKCVRVIGENREILGVDELENGHEFHVLHEDSFVAVKQFSRAGRIFDVVFLDPPYDQELAKKALKTLGAYVILHANSRLIIEHDKREILPEETGRIHLLKRKKYGSKILSIYALSVLENA